MRRLIDRLVALAREEPAIFRMVVLPYVGVLVGLAARYGLGVDPEAVIGGLVLLLTVSGPKLRSLVTPEHRALDRSYAAWNEGWSDGYAAGGAEPWNFPPSAGVAWIDPNPPASCP